MRSDCIIDGLGYTTLDPQAFETALHNFTRVSGGTGCVSYSRATFTMVRIGRRSWKELEDTVAAAVDSSGCDLVADLSRIHLQHTVRVKMPRTATGAVQATRHG